MLSGEHIISPGFLRYKRMKYLITAGLISFISVLYAQENSRGKPETDQESFSDLTQVSSEKTMSRREYKKTFHYKFYKHHEKLIEEYYERMEDNVKKYKRMARIMKRPQYSDWSYFGHKRKPKKRPVGKRKFCEECGIVH